MKIILYTKPDCPLCDQALAQLERLRSRFDLELQLYNILEDPNLVRRYGEKIPVVCIEGRERFYGRVDAMLLERELRAASRKNL